MTKQFVLMFHGVGEPGNTIPADELPYWVGMTQFEEILKCLSVASQCEVVWTFDDGNASDLLAAEKLASAGIRGKFFVLTERIGRPGYLSEQDIVCLDQLGMEVGSHGCSHVDWRKANEQLLDQEIDGSRTRLAQIIGRPVTTIAIPFGYYNARVFNRLKRSDCTTVYTSDTGVSNATDRFVRRNPVKRYHSCLDVIEMINGRVALGQRVRRIISPRGKTQASVNHSDPASAHLIISSRFQRMEWQIGV